MMFGSTRSPEDSLGVGLEPKPRGVRMAALNSVDRMQNAQYRFEALNALLRAAGCSTSPSPRDLAVNFHTGDHLMIAQVDHHAPQRIRLMMLFTQQDGDLANAQAACAKATAAQFASKASAVAHGDGFEVTISVGVYAEAFHSFADSLKAYADDIIRCYDCFIDAMIETDA